MTIAKSKDAWSAKSPDFAVLLSVSNNRNDRSRCTPVNLHIILTKSFALN